MRFSETLFEPPENVGVAPTVAPEEDSTVTLCGMAEEFVKLIETVPAFALSVLLSNFSWPCGSAARLKLELAPLAGAGVEVAAELDVVGVAAAGGEDSVELLVDELPQPASASSPTINAGVSVLAEMHLRARIVA